jgi:hypothetical protein
VTSSPSSLLDLLWEAESELTLDAPATEESRRIRDAAAALQQHLGGHSAHDAGTEWSEVEVKLPHEVARHRSALRRAPPQVRPRSGKVTPKDLRPAQGRKPLPRETYDGPAPPATHEHASTREIIVRLLQLIASPDLQRRLAHKLPGKSLQREIARLWFMQYRPVRCEDLFSADTAASLRALSAKMRKLLERNEFWSAPVELLLADQDWRHLTQRAAGVLELLQSCQTMPKE